jgi:hypothetical protein
VSQGLGLPGAGLGLARPGLGLPEADAGLAALGGGPFPRDLLADEGLVLSRCHPPVSKVHVAL